MNFFMIIITFQSQMQIWKIAALFVFIPACDKLSSIASTFLRERSLSGARGGPTKMSVDKFIAIFIVSAHVPASYKYLNIRA